MTWQWSEVVGPAQDRFPWMSKSQQRRLGLLIRRADFLESLGSEASQWDRAEAKAIAWALDYIEATGAA